MSRRTISTLRDGDSVDEVFLATDKQLRNNRNGQSFIQVTIQDRSGNLTGRVWNAGEALFRTFEIGEYIRVKGKAQLFQGALQLIVNNIEKIDSSGVNLADFLPRTEQDITKLFERLRGYLMKLTNPYLKSLAQCYLMDDKFVAAFCQAPAGVKVHHAYVGGLLEHVTTMMDVADRILPFYPDVNRDLLMIGVFLHDTGKIRELTYESAFNYSDEGQLLGHMNIGIEMLKHYEGQVKSLLGENMPEDLSVRLKHMIISHHGTAEFGSPKIPMTPEAVALHAIDSLDSRIHITVREIKDDVISNSNWTPYNAALQRKLYKGPKPKNGTPAQEDED
ncbi:HD domain-containing protein [Telmatocola sphagniphila]|uniref:HD domain-containing protein n=1 Tax=Telmatocola sphagniphila TaxID=1123043 RepID=A0A8E6EWF3_9BACT|nr:OB-fold nucleic acid binding domain-containing protein [Telmatocola sphagniphila]QVL30518.1 HD domain-containing protein [Telmatocola sphagniphila]